MKKPIGNPANLGRKGGTRYPKISLEKAEKYVRSLASKTHTSPQPFSIISKGVFETSGSHGEVRLSACRQFGLVDGKNAALQASAFAKKLLAATESDRQPILEQAFLKPEAFRKLHTGFQGDTRTRAEIRSQFLQLDVHPDLAEECTGCFVQSGLYCGLIQQEGEKYRIVGAGSTQIQVGIVSDPVEEAAGACDDTPPENGQMVEGKPAGTKTGAITNKSNVSITLDIDSTMDPEKLSKLVKILKDSGLA